jgi:hypothetical protein
MADLPRIPDEAFYAVQRAHVEFEHVASQALADSDEVDVPAQSEQAADNFFRSLGLDGENDSRAYGLAHALMAHVRSVEPAAIPNAEVRAAVFGLTLGLMLAQATGWEAPMVTGDDRE